MTINYDIVSNWYGNVLPKSFKLEEMIKFCYKSNQFLKIVNPISSSRLIVKKMESGSSAYTDGLDCFIPTRFFDEQFYAECLLVPEKEIVKACIGLINAVQIHESIHIEIFENTFTDMSKIISMHDNENIRELKYNKNFCNIYNIVEDEFIEYWFSVKYKNYNEFLVFARNLLFSRSLLISAYSYHITKISNETIIGVLSYFRNDDNLPVLDEIGFDIKFKMSVNYLKSVRDVRLTINDRLNIAYEIYKLLVNPKKDNDAIYETGIDSLPTIVNALVSQDLYLSDQMDIEEIAIKHQTHIDNFEINVEVRQPKTKNSYVIKHDKLFTNFSNLIKYAKDYHKSLGMPKDIGSKIDNNLIHRIVIDSKIFRAKNGLKKKPSEPEIIILIDWSGSMLRNRLYLKVLNATYSIFKNLYENGVNCAVYAHTTDDRERASIVYAIAAFNMPFVDTPNYTTRDYEIRFKNMVSEDSNENADGIAIEYVSTQFSKRNTTKTLVVISDGLPNFSCFNYVEEIAVNHTKSVVNCLRDSNIDVLSLSLVEGVIEDNDKIYGKNYNVNCSKNLEENFKQVVYNLTKRGK